jgi:glycosyltransferase involved in cell wall biosynthesis
MSSMRIAELVDSLAPGGTERLVVDLARSLQAKGHHVTVICLRKSGPLADSLVESDIEVVALEKPEGISLPVLGSLTGLLRRQRIDVLHTHNPLVHHYGVVAAKLAGVRVVVNTIHGLINLSRRIGLREIVYALSSLATEKIVTVCTSGYVHFRDQPLLPKNKLTVVNNGIVLDRFTGISKCSGTEVIFGAVGRLVPVKDHETLLRAFAQVVNRYPHARLRILGDGPLRSHCEKLAKSLGVADVVQFRGFNPDVPAFMSELDIFVLCSRSEALPLTLIEAMASGLPVVATAVGEIPNLIRSSDYGRLCSPGKPDEMAAAMISLIETPDRQAIGRCAREMVIDMHSIERMTTQYESLFQQLCTVGPHRVADVRTKPAAEEN